MEYWLTGPSFPPYLVFGFCHGFLVIFENIWACEVEYFLRDLLFDTIMF